MSGNKKHRIRKSIIWNWMISYLIIAVVMLGFGAIMYGWSIWTVRSDVETMQRQAVSQLAADVETMTDDLQTISYTLANSANESGLYLAKESNSKYFSPLSAAQLQKTMVSYATANQRISGIYMYFPDNGYLMSSTILYQYDLLGDRAEYFTGISGEELESFLQQGTSGHLAVLDAETSKPSLYYVYCSRQYRGKIVVYTKLAEKMLQEMGQLDDTSVCLLVDNEPYWLSGEETLTDELYERLSSSEMDEKGETMEFSDGTSFWSGVKLADNTFLITSISAKNYYSAVDRMRNYLLLYILLACVISGIAAVIFSRRQYRPVKELLREVLQNNNEVDSAEEERSEYEIISDYYGVLKKKYDQSSQELRESRYDIINSRLARILHSSEENFPADLLRKIPNGEIFEDGSSILVGMLANNGNESLPEKDRDYQLQSFVIQNIVTEVLQNEFPGVIPGEVDGFIVFWIRMKSGNPVRNKPYLQQQLEYAVYNVERVCQIRLTVNVSCLIENVSQVGKALDEIKELQEYRDWDADDDLKIRDMELVLQHIYRDEEKSKQVDSFQRYKKMQDLLAKNEYEKLQQLLQEAMGETAGGRNEKETGVQAAESEKPQTAGHSHSGKNSGQAKRGQIVQEIKDYIDNHYNDWQLSGSMLADRYDVSLSYLSQIFKKETGTGLLDYINRTRYTKAKAMIDAGMTIQEAAEKAGYSSPQPLRRLFRQFEGVTPSQSRKKGNREES